MPITTPTVTARLLNRAAFPASRQCRRQFSAARPVLQEIRDAYILSAARTPTTKFNGSFTSVSAPQLGAVAIKSAVEKSNVPSEYITDVYMGNVLQGSVGQAPARQATIFAGLSPNVESMTVNKVCASGLKAVVLAAQNIQLGLAGAQIAGGMENMSRVPYYLPRSSQLPPFGELKLEDGLIKDGLWDVYNQFHMGICAETTAKKHEISREAQDAYAISSYQNAQKAWAEGRFAEEIAPVTVKSKKGDLVIERDEGFENLREDKLKTLKPAFLRDGTGTVTAGNASTMNDGASALVLTNKAIAQEYGQGSRVLARIVSSADAAVDPVDFPVAPAKAVPIALERAGITKDQVAVWEFNEAFAAVIEANKKILGLHNARVNPLGGAISLGHALGSSGSRILVTLLHQLQAGEYGPHGSLPAAQFHDWYNSEHGPLRLRLPFITNGFRYRAVDSLEPEWVALYDITEMEELNRETYLSLRGDGIKTTREKNTMSQIDVGRKLYDLLQDEKSADFEPLERVKDTEAAGHVLISNTSTLPADNEKETDLKNWYKEEHIPMLSKVPGWRRSRLFVTSYIDSKAPREFVALHEFTPQNGLGGAEHKASMETPWREKVAGYLTSKQRRVYNWAYTFGPAPRELSSLASSDTIGPWNSNDRKTRTLPSTTNPAVESFITTSDGVELQYRLEGSTNPHAPILLLSNSILVDYTIWDSFVSKFLSEERNKKYRVLRYNTRGRETYASETPVTVDVLASDVIALLDALRIPSATLIGVSLGGVTVLNTSLLYPERVKTFISCDTNSSAPATNAKAWNDRADMAASEGAVHPQSKEAIIGEELSEITVRRWFTPESYEFQPEVPEQVKQVVRNNSLAGFKKAMQALCAYDVRDRMKEAKVRGLFVAGEKDGVLPKTMQQMAEDLRVEGQQGAELKLVSRAGHLPMVENPDGFLEIVDGFIH
ncbi:Thiolase, N-terminal domain-containing protein [Aspergillus karnatakaensis]|uniref:Thiolase, N-terminal domain-containing protein n=1 Tax=Aspergillus karnatakaensis TaxID=1810916 RepID=UPI003CCD8E46